MSDLLRKQLAKRPLLDRLEGRARNMRAAGDEDTAALLDDAAAHVRAPSPAPDVERRLEAMTHAAQLGLEMALANDLYKTAETIRAALATQEDRDE